MRKNAKNAFVDFSVWPSRFRTKKNHAGNTPKMHKMRKMPLGKKMQYAILGFCIFLAFFGHYLMQLPPRTRQNDDAPGWQQVHAQPPSKRWAVWGRSLCCCSIDECSYPVQAFLFGLLPKSIGIVHASLRNSIKDNVDSSWNIMLGGLMVNLNIAKAAVHCVPSRFHMCNC